MDDQRRKKEFQGRYPEIDLVDSEDCQGMHKYLLSRKIVGPEEDILSLRRAGEGNMNCTLRVQTKRQSIIVKQSRPWVEKFPSILAPWDRVLSEATFYRLVAPELPVANHMPQLLHLDTESRIIVLEDLGPARDYTTIYQGASLSYDTATALATWLSRLHSISFTKPTREDLRNREMRELNHEHLFRIPFQPNNGLALDEITPGLSAVAQGLICDEDYREQASILGDIYLSDGLALLHGDFFPGSWLQSDSGPRVIDPEFAFFGCPEFDVGVLLAHLYMAKQSEAVHEACLSAYRIGPQFSTRLALSFCGIEITRRLIGLAQLRVELGLNEKKQLLQFAKTLVTSDDVLSSPHLLARQRLAQLPQGAHVPRDRKA